MGTGAVTERAGVARRAAAFLVVSAAMSACFLNWSVEDRTSAPYCQTVVGALACEDFDEPTVSATGFSANWAFINGFKPVLDEKVAYSAPRSVGVSAHGDAAMYAQFEPALTDAKGVELEFWVRSSTVPASPAAPVVKPVGFSFPFATDCGASTGGAKTSEYQISLTWEQSPIVAEQVSNVTAPEQTKTTTAARFAANAWSHVVIDVHFDTRALVLTVDDVVGEVMPLQLGAYLAHKCGVGVRVGVFFAPADTEWDGNYDNVVIRAL